MLYNIHITIVLFIFTCGIVANNLGKRKKFSKELGRRRFMLKAEYQTRYQTRIVAGEPETFRIVEYKGRIGLETRFVLYDEEVEAGMHRTHIRLDSPEAEFFDDYDVPDLSGTSSSRSIRFYNPIVEQGEHPPVFQVGEEWEGVVRGFSVGSKKTKDNRTIIFIGVNNLKRKTVTFQVIVGHQLIGRETSGSVLIREWVIVQLYEKSYRFRCGDRLVEFRALGTENGPVKRIGAAKVQTRRQFFDATMRDLKIGPESARRVWEGIPLSDSKEFAKYTASSDFFDQVGPESCLVTA